MIASSGHTMEYVGSGTNYNALPENGGVPNTAKQIVESNDGKIWTATTDHNGRFAVGDFFAVDQRTGEIEFSGGSVAFDLVTDETPELGGQLDALDNKIVNLDDPTAAQDAATKNYVDTAGYANYSDTTANFTGTLQNGGSNVVVDSDIGSTVQAYDAGLEYLNGLNFTNEATFKSGVNLEIGTDVQAYDAGLAYLDGLNFTDEASFKTGVNLEIGVDVQAYDAGLAYLDGLNFTDEASFKTAVNLEIGTDVQAHDANTAKTDVAQDFTAAQRGAIESVTVASSDTTKQLDFSAANNFAVTLNNSDSCELQNPSSLTAGQSGSIFIIQGSTGSHLLSYGSSWDFIGGTPPTLTTAASAVDRIDYVVRSSTSIHAVATLNYS